jgi:hypothetical protein
MSDRVGLSVRDVRAADWDAIPHLAAGAVAHVADAGEQDEWCRNRREFARDRGVQRQYVVEDSARTIVGYGAVECVDGEFRLFIVTRPEALTTAGEALYRTGIRILRELGAESVSLTEYANDTPLLAFAADRGFRERRRFALPGGARAISLEKELRSR